MRTIDDYFSSLTRFLEKRKSIVALEPDFPYQRITDQFGMNFDAQGDAVSLKKGDLQVTKKIEAIQATLS